MRLPFEMPGLISHYVLQRGWEIPTRKDGQPMEISNPTEWRELGRPQKRSLEEVQIGIAVQNRITKCAGSTPTTIATEKHRPHSPKLDSVPEWRLFV